MADKETIKGQGMDAIERIKNKFKYQLWNPIFRRDLTKVTKVGETEPLPQRKYKFLETELGLRLGMLDEIEKYFGEASDEEKLSNGKPGAWYHLTKDVYSDLGPYTPESAKRERDLLEHGSLGTAWISASKDDVLEEMTEEEIIEKFGMETWPLPIKMIDGTIKVYRFPIPRGLPVIFQRGDVNIVRYFGRLQSSEVSKIYEKFNSRLMDDLNSQMTHISDPAEKKIWNETITKLRKAMETAISGYVGQATKREADFRSFLETMYNTYASDIKVTVTDIIKESPSRKANIAYQRTYHTAKTIALPIRFEGENPLDEGKIDTDKGIIPEGADLSKHIKPGVWLGPLDRRYMHLKFSRHNKPQPADHVRENIVAGFLDDELNFFKLADDIKLKDEIAPGFDQFGQPLEVTDDPNPKVFIDKHLGRHVRHIKAPSGRKSVLNVKEKEIGHERLTNRDFTKQMSGIEIVNLIHNEWDTYRDDLRDARWHPKSPTAQDYAIAASPSANIPEFARYDSKGNKISARMRFKDINTDTRGYKMELFSSWKHETVLRNREATNLSPALDIHARQSWDHPGHLYWHGWPVRAQKDGWGVNIEKAAEGQLTTRGASAFLVDVLTRQMKYKKDLDATFETYVKGFDYGPRLITTGFVKNPHSFKTISNLNAETK